MCLKGPFSAIVAMYSGHETRLMLRCMSSVWDCLLAGCCSTMIAKYSLQTILEVHSTPNGTVSPASSCQASVDLRMSYCWAGKSCLACCAGSRCAMSCCRTKLSSCTAEKPCLETPRLARRRPTVMLTSSGRFQHLTDSPINMLHAYTVYKPPCSVTRTLVMLSTRSPY